MVLMYWFAFPFCVLVVFTHSLCRAEPSSETFSWLVKKFQFHASFGTGRLIIVFTSACPQNVLSMICIHPTLLKSLQVFWLNCVSFHITPPPPCNMAYPSLPSWFNHPINHLHLRHTHWDTQLFWLGILCVPNPSR